MVALVTGASSGIGRDMARYLNTLGYDLIITARNEEELIKLKEELNSKNNLKVYIIVAALETEEGCLYLYNKSKEYYDNIDLLINNAGFGLFGSFLETDLNKELEMINVNIKAVHILTKLFLKDMVKKDSGIILNVASIASFMAGPLMLTYYSSKNYVLRMSQAIREELKKKRSNVKISVLCPGPVATNFNNVANVKFNLKQKSSQEVAKYAIDKTLKNKFMIMPGITVKLSRFGTKLFPDIISTKVCYHMQEKKDRI